MSRVSAATLPQASSLFLSLSLSLSLYTHKYKCKYHSLLYLVILNSILSRIKPNSYVTPISKLAFKFSTDNIIFVDNYPKRLKRTSVWDEKICLSSSKKLKKRELKRTWKKLEELFLTVCLKYILKEYCVCVDLHNSSLAFSYTNYKY